jgi:hypothetical protein
LEASLLESEQAYGKRRRAVLKLFKSTLPFVQIAFVKVSTELLASFGHIAQ